MTTSYRFRAPAALALGLLALAPAAPRAAGADAPPPGEYRIVDGRVDPGTYNGWRIFHSTCYACHGVGAVGTDVAPNLVERIRTMSQRAFVTKVLTSYRIVLSPEEAGADNQSAAREAMIDEVLRKQRGRAGRVVMPAWGDNPRVQPHVLDLFAYLTARADGKLGPGKPRLMAGGR